VQHRPRRPHRGAFTQGANLNDIATFNEIISYLCLIELQFWDVLTPGITCNVLDPLLVQLDCCFTSHAWSIKCPNTG
jgi:hypothetical protein